MKTNKITQAIATALGTLTLFGLTLPAVANQEIESGWYLGVGGGSARATIDRDDIIADLLASGYTTTEFSDETTSFGFKVYGGYQFNRYISIEGGYFDLGEFNYTATTVPAGTSFGELAFDGWNLDLVAMLPFTEKSSLFGRIGAHNSKSSVDFVGTGAVNVLNPRYQKTSTDYKFGVGYQYEMTPRITFRIEAERYRMDDAVGNHGDIDFFSANLIYRFGARSRPEPTPAPAPRAVVTAPVQAAAATTQYCSALEIQFEIANDDIQRINREHVLVLATFLDKYPETTVQIEGHTDNVGNRPDNLRLSQQRAENAVDYLVREHGIDRDRLSAVGYGESRPIADNSTEAGKQANRRINAVIDCANDIEGLTPLPARVTLAMELEFDTNSSVVDPKYHEQLGTVAGYLRSHPDLDATLEGHTDNASPDMAQRISQERAQSVADYLVTHFGVDRSRLTAEGFGATRRDTYNITASGRQENRRVIIILDYPK